MSTPMPNKTLSESHSVQGYWVVVPAAGVGSRMETVVPKQYLMLGEKTILEHTIDRLLKLPSIEGVVLAVSKEDSFWSDLSFSKNPLLHVVEGGSERAFSVLNGLEYLHDKIQKDDWVLVHDAARPCVLIDSINKLFNLLHEDNVGGILALPVSDTLKLVGAENEISNTIDRSNLWQAQTPQMFRYQLLLDCLRKSLSLNHTVTDEASAVEFCGYAPKVVVGRGDNIKITRKDDLNLAAFILQQQKLLTDDMESL